MTLPQSDQTLVAAPADRYRLASRERRRRRPWWVPALVVALAVGAFTYVAREARDVGIGTSPVVQMAPAPAAV